MDYLCLFFHNSGLELKSPRMIDDMWIHKGHSVWAKRKQQEKTEIRSIIIIIIIRSIFAIMFSCRLTNVRFFVVLLNCVGFFLCVCVLFIYLFIFLSPPALTFLTVANSMCKAGAVALLFEWLICSNGSFHVRAAETVPDPLSTRPTLEFARSKSSQLVSGIAVAIVCPLRLTPRSVTDLLPHAGASPSASLPQLSRSTLWGSRNLEAFCFHYHNAWRICLEGNSARPVAPCSYTEPVLRRLWHNLTS